MGQGDAEENGAGVLFFQVTVDGGGRGASNAAVTNARCVELCDWWDKCVTYEYFRWDGGRDCGDESPNGCGNADAYMRCELWVYPTDASVYSAIEEHVDDVWCGAAGNGPHNGVQTPQNWPDLDDPTLKPNQPWPPVVLPTIPVPICTKSLDYVLIFEWKADNPYHNYAEGEHKTDFIAFVENWVHHIDHGPELNQARGGVIMMNAPSTADCDTDCDTTVSSDLSSCPCIEWVSRFPQTSGAQIMGDLAAWVASHDPPSGSRRTDIINALDAAASALDDEYPGEAIGLSKSIVFALSDYSDTYSATNAKVNEVTARTTSTGEEWNVYFLSVGGVLASGVDSPVSVAHWGDMDAATFIMPNWVADGFSGTSPHHGHEIMQGWAEHSCPAPLPVYALVAPDTRCDMSGLAGFTSHEWTGGQSFLSCCSDTNSWSGAASGQTFEQLRANCEAACSSGAHGQCNVITYYSGGASCNLGYYDGLVRIALVDSVLNNECQAAQDMSTWVLATTDAYTLVGADTKCEIHTRATWASYDGDDYFHECCAAHDGDEVATQSFEQLKANCEAACDGWAAVSGRGSCNVITYNKDELSCELGYYDTGTDAFEQRIANGDCSSDARYDTYVRNTPLERLVPTACFMDSEHATFPCTGCIDGDRDHISTHVGCHTDGNDGDPHFVDVYFPAADISRVVVHNRKQGDCYGTHCTYRLGNLGWEVWYLPTSKGEGAYVEGDHPNGYPYALHWVKCFETDVSTEGEEVLEVDCVASDVFAVRIVQKYTDTMNLNEVEVYGTAVRKWVLGQTGDVCNDVCAAHGLSCSSADQTLLTSCELMLDAMRQAGETCTCETTPGYEYKDYAGTPYVWNGDKCVHFTPDSSETSSCDANLYPNSIRPLCHCYSTGDNCVLSGAAHPVDGHDCRPAPGGAGSTDDAFCKDTGHGGCPMAWCMGSGTGKCQQNLG